jgi:hypothetical protein
MRALTVPVQPGQVIQLAGEDRRWDNRPLRMQVTRVRDDLVSHHNGDRDRWLEGFELDEHGQPVRRLQELVDLDLLPRALQRGARSTSESGPVPSHSETEVGPASPRTIQREI